MRGAQAGKGTSMRSVAEPQTPQPDGRLRIVIKDVTAQPDRLQEAEAIALCNRHLASNILPKEANLVTWLVRTIGKQAALRLVAAYARHRCLCCRKGFEPGDSRNARGRRAEGEICARCLATCLRTSSHRDCADAPSR